MFLCFNLVNDHVVGFQDSAPSSGFSGSNKLRQPEGWGCRRERSMAVQGGMGDFMIKLLLIDFDPLYLRSLNGCLI